MSAPGPLPTVDPRETGADALLDVREDDEWAAGHAPQAVHVPMSAFLERLGEVPEGPLAVVCRSGHRSAQVTQYLLAQGRTARNVDGGMLAWQALGLPVVVDGGAPGQVA